MLKFTARSSAPIQYLDSDAKRLLKILGKEGSPGIVTVAQLPAAIAALEQAVAREEAALAAAAADAASEGATATRAEADTDGGAERGPAISLRQRSAPLLQLLRTALANEEDVVWGV
ncbi:DUF1840 domain-containing protein [Corticibacter populi]|uniref:DUF1840 domain-containing protein n=1 Tax=Corticibacter populi TaxID=1550736 RepID=A0A3M6QSF4_9BURK|nr:DUF1840 domain-containing protein [Corticibacter populi]RMX05970.1 DUF1840 domain-containing protein [Corticibacter populi]RZS30702.1 uncharacterized protein DUF1840 [Corticibacter populi]